MSQRLICASGDLVDGGSGIRFEITDETGNSAAFAIRFRGKVYGYRNACSHVPVELDWKPGEFFDQSKLYLICAMHGARYAPETGRCVDGRCNGKGLQSLPLFERNGQIFYGIESQDGSAR